MNSKVQVKFVNEILSSVALICTENLQVTP